MGRERICNLEGSFVRYRGVFVMEYCGEVCTTSDFEQRKLEYSKEKRRHYYFMSLKTDEVRISPQYNTSISLQYFASISQSLSRLPFR